MEVLFEPFWLLRPDVTGPPPWIRITCSSLQHLFLYRKRFRIIPKKKKPIAKKMKRLQRTKMMIDIERSMAASRLQQWRRVFAMQIFKNAYRIHNKNLIDEDDEEKRRQRAMAMRLRDQRQPTVMDERIQRLVYRCWEWRTKTSNPVPRGNARLANAFSFCFVFVFHFLHSVIKL